MAAEPDLGQSEDPRELVCGDVEAVRATVGHLTDLAEGFGATAGGLRAIEVGAWTGAAADAFRVRFADAAAQWSQAAEAFGSAARAWERFRSTLAAAQERAGTAVVRFRSGATAADQAHTAYAAEMVRYLECSAAGQNPGPEPVLDDSGALEMEAAHRTLADARALRDSAADDAARRIADASARSPDPPTGWNRLLAEAADWVGANGIELAHAAGGVGEGVEGFVRSARALNPADPYNLNHPGRFVENTSTALSGVVGTLAHPLRLVTDLVGTGWGSDPARAFGHLVPVVMTAASAGARPVLGAADAETARSVLGAAREGAEIAGTRTPGPVRTAAGQEGRPGPQQSLWADPHPAARPFTPHPTTDPHPAPESLPDRPAVDVQADRTAGAVDAGRTDQAAAEGRPAAHDSASADRAAAERFDRLGRDLRSRIDRLAPKDFAPPATSARPTTAKTSPAPRSAPGGPELDPIARALDPPRRRVRPPDPHHDPERARRARLTRGDKDFSSPLNRHGARKSHLDARGDLVPANPEGSASVVEHVVGRRSPVKGESPYSSFTSPGARAEVQFGGYTIEVDVVRLQADIEAGLVPGVEILPPHRVQAAIQADADRIAGRPVDLYVRKGHTAGAARSYGLGAEATTALRQRMIDMANAQRHHEWMIRGVVPGRYVVGPHREGRHG